MDELKFNRRKSREVFIGKIAIGNNHPIRIQSMTTYPLSDISSTLDQILQLCDAGCEVVRLAIRGKKDAYLLDKIKDSLEKKKFNIPLVADVHFYPPAAIIAADFVEKIRINPGNFITSDFEDKLEKVFVPLVEKCKRLKRTMRIGANLGSLSDRIIDKYGHGIDALVQSVLEYASICSDLDYHDLVFSLKASSPSLTIDAYRMCAQEMDKVGFDYPFHLGVTEAGEGLEGRVKSFFGIGALLLEGIGDTLRVSLTEDPVKEIDPCKRLIRMARPCVNIEEKKRYKKDRYYVFLSPQAKIEASQDVELDSADLDGAICRTDLKPCFDPKPIQEAKDFVLIEDGQQDLCHLLDERFKMFFLHFSKDRVLQAKQFFSKVSLDVPVILYFKYDMDKEDLIAAASSEMGLLLKDGYADGICIDAACDAMFLKDISFSILQACNLKMTKTEFVSCPGCGRTRFDIQKLNLSLKKNFSNIPGCKIAVMGCCINGIQEVMDADFGVVGSLEGKVDIYKDKKCYKKNVDANEALQHIEELVKCYR